MRALTEFLFPAPARRTTGAVIGWWERRRLAYNLWVGGAGLISLGTTYLVAALPPGGVVLPFPWLPIVIFGGMANVCYLLGPTVELLIDRLWGRAVLPTGPALFRMGLTFSVGLALFPALIMTIGWVIRIVLGIGLPSFG
jgi:hypothetical protein